MTRRCLHQCITQWSESSQNSACNAEEPVPESNNFYFHSTIYSIGVTCVLAKALLSRNLAPYLAKTGGATQNTVAIAARMLEAAFVLIPVNM